MKRFALLVMMLFSCLSVSAMAADPIAPWVSLNSGAYTLPPSGNLDVLLMATIDSRSHQVTISILNLESGLSLCVIDGQNQTSDLGEESPFKVNGRYVRMHGICINGTEIDHPSTAEGESYLLGLVESGITIDVAISGAIHPEYKPENFHNVKQALLNTSGSL